MKQKFESRHIGPREHEIPAMLKTVGVGSVEELTNRIVPAAIRLKKELNLPEPMSEYDYRAHITELASRNEIFRSYIGLGYSNCIVPAPIQRNILENPGWYTAYTPYQAEIAQGRLEALLNFQTMVVDLTGLPIANASLLDEGTAAGEAMIMFYNARGKEAVQRGANMFFISDNCLPQTIDVLKTRSAPLGIEVIIGNHEEIQLDDRYFGAIVQYPASDGQVIDYKPFTTDAHNRGILVAAAADLLSLALLTPPGEWGADAVVGNTQRFGVPLGYGGPHAAFFATRDEFKRQIPGRIIGVSIDARGRQALRMALQTREQHIKRDKATSNICTAQALLAIMASMYSVYHGPGGIRRIAARVHSAAGILAAELGKLGYTIVHEDYFDTLKVQLPAPLNITPLKEAAEKARINLRYIDYQNVGISLDETISASDLNDLIRVFSGVAEKPFLPVEEDVLREELSGLSDRFVRKSPYLQHPVFNSYHSETELMRYIKKLENKDLSLTHSMISLGSCTMKLNAASELYPITNPGFADIHPFAPLTQVKGYQEMIRGLEQALCEITGFAAISFQPNSGAQGEYAGLLVIREYHHSRGEGHRNVALIPSSAHGTNPASAVMAGMKVVVVKCDHEGNIDLADLRARAEQHSRELSCLMVTYPSTHGVYEESIMEITGIIHEHGGQVYMDGANMNAQVGLTNPATIGADVCHLNLHKTFAIPHGGGGPGMGPIGVAPHLVPFLPSHPVIRTGGDQGITAVSSAPWGSALILLISYGYVRMLGARGVKRSTEMAILNANYLKAKLEQAYPVLYQGRNNHVAHEMILDCRQFKKDGVEVEDIAKRLMDYGFHAPTVSFPVAGTLMVEPTESESQQELDRFVDAMISIRNEISEVASGSADKIDNVLKNAPHTADAVVNDAWDHSYGREKAAYPLEWIRAAKFWPSVSRVDNAYGDRNLVCSCPPLSDYEQQEAVLAG